MKKRLLAAVLCLAMLISCVPSFAFQAQASELPVITCNGSAQSAVSFPRNERITLTAEGGSWYQWQIKVNDSLWVNISGETGETLDVSYAMIANLCQGDTAYLRVATDGERFSDPVAVTAGEAVIKEAAAPAAASYVVQAAPQVVVSNPSSGSSANSEAVAQAQAALTDAEAAANEAAEVAVAAEEDASAKQAAYYEAQNKADAAKQAMEATAVTTEIPAETSAEEVDENGNPVVVKPAETMVNYNSELQTAYAAAQAEADAAWQVYSEAALTLADAEANLEAAQEAVETAAAELEAAQSTQTADSGRANYDLPKNYSVVVNYVSESGADVADPYIASLAAGSNFSATVTFPTVQGYLPYLGEDQRNSLVLNITEINQDYTYTVVYKPTNVDYTVIHYKQNLNDDKYTEAERETKQGLTESTVPDVAKSYEGFYKLLYEKPVIAADGSTLVEIYYDRYYYLMNFNLDGGYGVEPIYARYGAPVSVGTPTKAGYSFAGWNPKVPDTVPVDGGTYAAVWTPDDTAKVTVVFWGENANDKEYSYLDYSAVVYMEPGKAFTYSPDNTLICALKVHTHDESCGPYLCGQEEHSHGVEEGCYQLICTQTSHNHVTDGCILDCTHTHTTACYQTGEYNVYSLVETTKPNQTLTSIGNGIYTYTTGNIRKQTHYYLNIGDKWYCAESGLFGSGGDTTEITYKCTHTHTDECYTCGQKEGTHTHSVEAGCYELICTKPVHTHSEACGRECGETAHTHTTDCYMNGAGLDSKLWTFVESDTVTVAADGSTVVNVYYKRTTFTLHFRKSNSSSDDYGTITEKWGANIRTKFNEKSTAAGTALWSTKRNGGDPWTSFLDEMPAEERFYYAYKDGNKKQTAYYYGENLDGTAYDVLLYTCTAVYGSSLYISDQDKVPIEGFTYSHLEATQTGNGELFDGAKFYYTRKSYTLTFSDGYNKVKEETVKYEAPLNTYSDFVPAVPSAYEPGSVVFGGWYLNPECTGEEYKLNDHTMPADNVLLYAKWLPVNHRVEFYLDADALSKGTELESHPAITVSHGSFADPTPKKPTNGNYTFVGWFYMENGVEKAFDFENMPVNKDLQVYGKWSSNVLKEYTILYKVQGTDTEIADKTTGSGLAGITKTFDAKGGTDLYAAYQEGYFPVTKSHSMTLDINATEENDTNVFTFWYVQKEAVPYTVKYLNKATGAEVYQTKTVSDNRKAVVTETFVPVSGMMPDAYQKRLVVSAEEGAVNEIIFYYTEDTTHAYYKITHYTENLGLDAQGKPTWTEYASSQAVGDIGTTYTADPMTISGFTYDSTVSGTVVSGELTANGLELKLYYTRNSYPYQVRYLEKDTGKQLADPKNGTGKYGQVISEGAIDITNYTAVAPTSQTLNIKIETPNDQGQIVAALNVITFYYTENEATINYVVVGPDGCGTVSLPSETLKVLTGAAQGSTATASNNTYKFVGWYENEACTTPVNASWVDANNKLTPVKAQDAAWQNKTYYAKFEYNLTTLTIKKSGAQNDTDGFIFKVEGDNGDSFTVSVKGNGSVTIAGVTVGATYTVTERSDWAWRYTVPGSQTITLVADGSKNAVTVANDAGKQYLLDGSAYAHNIDETKPAGDK